MLEPAELYEFASGGSDPGGPEPDGAQAGDGTATETDGRAGVGPTADGPTAERPAHERPAGANPAGANPPGESPAAANPAGESPAGAIPTGAKPPGETPTGATSAGESTADESPTDAHPATEAPAHENPTGAGQAHQGAETEGPVLLVALDGFVDAGHAARLAVEALRAEREERTVVRFDVDQLVDYRSRRPPLQFDTNRWTGYTAPELVVVRLTDTDNTEYLLLVGPEPDTQWERFSAAVIQVVERLGVRLVINLTAIPMAVPHTRPIGVTAHGTRPELTEHHEAWFTTAEVPGSAVGLMELRLGEAGHAAMGFAVHVPHYLSRAEYPQAARVLLDHVGLAAGLYLPTEPLSKAALRADAEIAEQVEASEEVKQVVQALERQYDTVSTGRGARSGLGLAGELPSADELAAEVEKFLADRQSADRHSADGQDTEDRHDDGPFPDGPFPTGDPGDIP